MKKGSFELSNTGALLDDAFNIDVSQPDSPPEFEYNANSETNSD